MRRLLAIASLTFAVAAAQPLADSWIEVRSPHFIVTSNAAEPDARRIAGQLERLRSIFHQLFPNLQHDPPLPIEVLALRSRNDFREVEPADYLAKGMIDLAGYFQATQERNFIILRLDAQEGSLFPYGTIYHEYTHQLTSAYADWMPVWLNEGLAEYYETAALEKSDVEIGRLDPGRLLPLRTANLMPLATLFAVDHSSPYYHEAQKGDMFYEESWALTHMLLTRGYGQKNGQKDTRLANYINLLQRHVAPADAATQAFGDLDALQKELQNYIGQHSYIGLTVKLSSVVDEKSFPAAPRTQAQADVVRGRVMAATRRFDDARALLTAALTQDPDNPDNNETMGWIELRQNHFDAALLFFEKAVAGSSPTYLAHYYYAETAMEHGNTGDDAAHKKIQDSFRAATQLNPSFAPAWDRLAMSQMEWGGDLSEAYLNELHAIQLEPGEFGYRYNAALLLMRQQRYTDAVTALTAARAVASNPGEVAQDDQMTGQLSNYQTALAQREHAAAAAPMSSSNTAPPVLLGALDTGGPPTLSHPAGSNEPLQATGSVTGVSCSPPNVFIALDTGSHTMAFQLTAANFAELNLHINQLGGAPAVKTCRELNGRRVNVQYRLPDNPDDSNVLLRLFLLPDGGGR